MGLNDIKLSSPLIVALYKNVIVEPGLTETVEQPVIKKTSATVTTDEWKSLGDNKKNILVAVNYPGITHLPDDELLFLTNILAACKLDLGDIAIVNIANTPQHNYKKYTDHFKSRIILLFGISPADLDLPVDFPAFQVQSVAGNTFLYSPSLAECKQDSLLKSKLWVCLRKVFTI